MTSEARDRLLNPLGTFEQWVTLPLVLVALAPLALTPLVLRGGRRWIPADVRRDAWQRYRGWLVLVPVLVAVVLLGAAWVVLGCAALGLLCFREYARATGLFREKVVCYLVGGGIAAAHLAALDNGYGLFAATFPMVVVAVAGVAAAQDRPKGYLQRVSLAVVAFALFGCCLGHLSFLSADPRYRPQVGLVLIAVGFWDVARYVFGRLLGGPKLVPNTRPDRTVFGAVAGTVVAVGFVMAAGWWVYEGTPLQHAGRLAALGLGISAAAQLGDLMLAAMKRDAGVPTLDLMIPGHGGLLDRFDTLILVAPVAYHLTNVFTGGG